MSTTLARRAALSLALVVSSIVLALLLGEGIVRVVAPVAITPQMYRSDPATIFRPKPNTDERGRLPDGTEWQWTTNAQGYRGPLDYAIPKPQSTRRVLVLGDSFTFGFGMNDDETYAAHLERLLNAACHPQPVEVVNAGVSGFSTSQSLALLETSGATVSPDVVVVGFFVNDPEDNIDKAVHALDERDSLVHIGATGASAYTGISRAKSLANSLPGYEWLIRHSMLANWARRLYFGVRFGEQANDGAAHPVRWGMAATSAQTPTDTALVSQQWRFLTHLYAQLNQTTSALGGRLLVLMLPDDSTTVKYLNGVSGEATTFQRMRGVCANLTLHCIDMAQVLVGKRHPVAHVASLYLPNEGHFSVAGHREAATALLPTLSQWLGCAAHPTDATSWESDRAAR